ncbi:alpha,alpha-trehalase nth1 [Mycoemilia scoparia]|uniref:Trehalase n=1 Tax=Mycoemilia scoparia TaxID=417184 RepID=A0A9W8DSB7_9FUNG|nr:alpha,alpha-trehalase nth1 [Mycoemilia scoparia]
MSSYTHSVDGVDVLAHPSKYYDKDVRRFSYSRTRATYYRRRNIWDNEKQDASQSQRRRGSNDDRPTQARRFLVDVEETEKAILSQEDTNGDFQITIEDAGPKVLQVPTAGSGGFQRFEIRGTYMLSNLLQEIALAKEMGRKSVVIDEARLNENPVNRLSRMIKTSFWDGLVRRIDANGIEIICADPKNTKGDANPRVYVPHDDIPAFDYYSKISRERPHLKLEVVKLPEVITPQYVRNINSKFGILSLAANVSYDENKNCVYDPITFAVPGGRFNEMYGWDSYFESLGLLVDGRVELAKGMVEHFIYEIKHYGKILNANRSYYLTRSQPPFLTDMVLRVYQCLPSEDEKSNLLWLRRAMGAAIHEYHNVWTSKPRLDEETGLSCYHPTGIGMPPETESTHFDHLLEPYANALGVSIEEYKDLYNNRQISEPELDAYFVHDRAVRESGHDTTYRLEKRCADLATVDLNCLLYKYEVDIAETITELFSGSLELDDGTVWKAETWKKRAEERKRSMDKYMWNDDVGMYFDYDVRLKERITYESVTTSWALWAGCATEEQALKIAKNICTKFEVIGGLVSGTEESRGEITLSRPNRQWDYPFGWAPHQMLAWKGLYKYGFVDVSRRLAYRWLYTITKSFVDFNGVVPEKFDVVKLTHRVKVEYGNVGTDFKMVPREGFGWMNASYQVGLTYITNHMKRALGALTPPDVFFARANWSTDSTPSHTPSVTPPEPPVFTVDTKSLLRSASQADNDKLRKTGGDPKDSIVNYELHSISESASNVPATIYEENTKESK